ncbi:ABC transporter substrate-binding protein [Geomonas sp. RF6]|uniref:MlaC/ttg2D family ABC transporter substrate-binding protein n=1 Tax=Geomonas sp. RF6 TaxID=2897342 RepID=UPI001E5CBFE3|nr:ABC transporter substrate-binding protein [Geomonas sp. RF6]UFS68708.1 ABC transporter substrate-binding protein [Geomonas sp. RF6]
MRRLAILVVSFFLLTLSVAAQAGASVTEEVKKTVDHVVQIVSDESMKQPQKEPQRRAQLKKAIGAIFDYGEMAQRSLGRHWKDRTPAERKEFVSLFETLLENSYSGKIESYHNEKIEYLKETVEGDYAEVRSKVITPKRDEYTLDYRLLKKGGKWMVYDVIIEGVSLVSNYRGQFGRIIANQGYPALVKKLRTKSNEIKAL